MKNKPPLSVRWASYIARYSNWTRVTYVLSLALSFVLFAMYYLGGASSFGVLWPAIFFLFLGILSFERSGFSTLIQSKDAEIAELRGKIGTPA